MSAAGWIVSWPTVGLADDALSFSRDVRPVLADKCFKCHGFDGATREGELRLDVRDGPEGSARVLDPGDGELLRRILSTDPDEVNDLAANPAFAEKVKELTKLLVEQQKLHGDTLPLSTDKPAPIQIELKK